MRGSNDSIESSASPLILRACTLCACTRFTLPAGLQLKNLAPLHALKAKEATASVTDGLQSLKVKEAAADGAVLDAAAAADKATNARDNAEGSGLMKLFACEVRLREGNVREI